MASGVPIGYCHSGGVVLVWRGRDYVGLRLQSMSGEIVLRVSLVVVARCLPVRDSGLPLVQLSASSPF